jgi:alpha-D-ribose 1-methylphosphonate 5-triphosphate diphosphatase PhnM
MSEMYDGGSMDDMDVVERGLRIASHGDAMMGQIVMQTHDGEFVAGAPVTLDHQTVGAMLRSDTGTLQAENLLHTDLSDEQKQLLEDMKRWNDDPEIDFANFIS